MVALLFALFVVARSLAAAGCKCVVCSVALSHLLSKVITAEVPKKSLLRLIRRRDTDKVTTSVEQTEQFH